MNKQQLKNLKKLPKVLREEAARRDALGDKRKVGDSFNMHGFGNYSCNTPACVLGTYAYRKDVQDTFRPLRCYYGIDIKLKGCSEVVYHDGLEVQAHFGLDATQAEELFGTKGCGGADNEEDAARFIEGFIEREEAEM